MVVVAVLLGPRAVGLVLILRSVYYTVSNLALGASRIHRLPHPIVSYIYDLSASKQVF